MDLFDSGWIKIYRKVKDHWVFVDPYFRAWVIILFSVNWEDKKTLIHGEIMECKRGQSLLSIDSWVKLFGRPWSPHKIRTFFDLLKTDNMINIEGLRKTTLLTVLNYDSYQIRSQTNDEQSATKAQPKRNQSETTKELNKNLIRIKKEYIGEIFVPEYLKDVWLMFLYMRKKIRKPITGNGQIIALKKLSKMGDEQTQVKIVEQSIERSYLGLFPVSENKNQKKCFEEKYEPIPEL
jgi:hypothetical protein